MTQVFQPIVSLDDHEILGYEVLGRGDFAGLPGSPNELFQLAADRHGLADRAGALAGLALALTGFISWLALRRLDVPNVVREFVLPTSGWGVANAVIDVQAGGSNLQLNGGGSLAGVTTLFDQGINFNAGAFTHYAWGLHDALAAFDGPVVELHLSNPSAREPWRHESVIAPVVTGSISGFGGDGYRLAVEHDILPYQYFLVFEVQGN